MVPRRPHRARYRGPIIAQNLVSDYLNRKLDNWDWVKRVGKPDLVQAFNGFRFSAAKQPFEHQLQCFALGVELPQFLFFLDMGGGKTALTLALYRWHRKHSRVRRMLVVMYKEVNVQSWLDEIALHAPELRVRTLLGSTKERRAEVTQDADIYLTNYSGLQLLMTDLLPTNRGKKRKRQVDPRLAERFAKRFEMVVLDESQCIGNSQSLVYRLCRHFTHHVPYRYALTGTPFGRDPTMLWSQFHVIDDGETLGKTLGLFRAAFFNAKEGFWGGLKYEFDERMDAELHRVIKHRSIYYRDTECSDLPPAPKPIVVRCPFSLEAKEQYRAVQRRIKELQGSKEEIENSFTRMRMCTSGFLSVREEDSRNRLTLHFEENPKLEALETLVHGVPADTKCLIYHDFVLTGKLIGRMLERNKLQYATLSGATKDPAGEMRRFLHDKKVRFLVANNVSGSTGINPQHVASYAIFYEAPVSPIHRKQAIKRLHRQGQKKRVHIYDLVVPGSVDEQVLEYLAQGKNLFNSIVGGDRSARRRLLEELK